MISIMDYYGIDGYAGLQSRVLIENDVPVVEFWKDEQLVATRSFPYNTLEYAENAAENYVLGVLEL